MTTKNLSNCTNGCNRRVWSQGICQSCYLRKFGRQFGSIEESYLSKVVKSETENDCWNWLGQPDPNGYGGLRFKRKFYLAHRISFYIHNGYWSKFDILHHCDNPICSNPKHLFEGTQQDNMRDRDAKGRCAKGEKQWLSKLTENQVIEIKKRIAKGEKPGSIASDFPVGAANIRQIERGYTWKHIKI